MSEQRGLALVLVLWVLSLLTIMAGSFALTMRRETAVVTGITGHARAQAYAEAGGRLAESMLIDEDPENRLQADGRMYELAFDEARIRVKVLSEMGKVDINHSSREVWLKLLEQAGFEERRQLEIADAVFDWVDADEEPREQGAEYKEYRSAGLSYRPPNRPFQSIEELRMVLGVDETLYGWLEPFITIYSGRKEIDVNKASRELLEILGAEDQLMDKFGSGQQFETKGDSFSEDEQIAALRSGETVTILSEAMLPDGTTAAVKSLVRLGGSIDGTPFQLLGWQSGFPGSGSLFAGEW